MNDNIKVLILAAGNGTRMKSNKPKVLHEISGKPMINHIIDTCFDAGIKDISIVLGNKQELIKKFIPQNINIIYQKKQLGTANAIKSASKYLEKFKGKILILYGDMPLIRKETIKNIIRNTNSNASIISFVSSHPKGYGRVVIDQDKSVKVIEEKNATLIEKSIKLCYSGIICANSKKIFLALDEIEKDKNTKEYLFTDVFKILKKLNIPIKVIKGNEEELKGVNDRKQLIEVDNILQEKIKSAYMKKGVTILSPDTVYIAYGAKISSDVLIASNSFIGKNVSIKANVTIKHGCSIEDAIIENGCEIGPMSRIRKNTKIGRNTKIGNFVEVKNSIIGKNSKVNHLAYIGDAKIGNKTNIGAGTITCNYDGINKNKTFIGNNVFIGSNCSLIAPIKVDDSSFIAAGSTISKNVYKNDFSIARARQSIIKNASARFLKGK
jgi:bifunctional UDP-N-acetylglucosamine pyrophosphorylase/glucosamine-1-phosphate N-acetyltransferase